MPLPDAPVKLRTSPWALVVMAPALVPGLAAVTLVGTPWLLVGLWAVVVAEQVLLNRWLGITLTDDQAVVQNLRRQHLPWSQVQAVTHEWYFGSRRLVLWTADRRVSLWAPVAPFGIGGARFERDFHTLGQWWLAHRGPASQPPPSPVS